MSGDAIAQVPAEFLCSLTVDLIILSLSSLCSLQCLVLSNNRAIL